MKILPDSFNANKNVVKKFPAILLSLISDGIISEEVLKYYIKKLTEIISTFKKPSSCVC